MLREYDLIDMPTDSCWENNLNSLRRYYPEWFDALLQIPYPGEEIQYKQAADGTYLLQCRDSGGEMIPLGSIQSPIMDAVGWVDGLGAECLRHAHVLLMGWGSGYHPMALFQRSDAESFLWIVEPNPAVIKAAFHILDFSRLLQSSRVGLLLGMPAESVAQRLFSGPGMNRMRTQGIRMVIPPVIRRLYPEYIKNLSHAISEAIQFDKLKVKTEEQQGIRILQNSVKNIPLILQGAPIQRLQGSAAAFPAAIVAPGPSLESALDWLLRYGEHMMVIAVDTAQRILHKKGIPSDIVVSLDYTELNVRHFESLHQDTATLAAFVGIDPAIPEKYLRKTYFFTHEASSLISMLRSLGSLGDLFSLGSTAHAAYHLARLMGCAPIILVGNDLGFPDGRWYTSGAMQNELDQPEREQETLLEIPANDGGSLKTSGLYKLYRDGFTELIQKTAGRVINTSLHGAKISGCDWMDLETVTNLLPPLSVDKSFLHKNLYPSLEARQVEVIQEIKAIAEACRRAHTRMKRLVKQMDGLHPAGSDFSFQIKKILQDFSRLLGEEPFAMSLCPPLCSRSTTAFLGQLGNTGWLGGKTLEQNRAAQVQGLAFLRDYQKALETNRQWLAVSDPD